MSQTSFSNSLPAFSHEGQKLNSEDDSVVSALAEGAIPFGKFVMRGTDKENQVKLPGLATDITNTNLVGGVAIHDQAREQVSGTAQYADKAAVSVLRKGPIVVLAEQTCVAGDDVYVRYAAGGSGVGSFGNTAGTSERALLAGAKWKKGATAGQLGAIEINLPA